MIGLIDIHNLNCWADGIEAFGKFPQLIRLIIHALVPSVVIKQIYFAAREATRLPGYDGWLELSFGTNRLPEGLSVWELSVEQKIKSKADDDYKKRTKDPESVDQKNTCFVFATPRSWSGKKAWADERSAEGKWKQVLAFDAEDLVQWLELAPGVASWFAQLTGQAFEGARSLMCLMEEYRFATNPKFDLAGTLIGRGSQCEILNKMLEAPPGVVEVEALTDPEGAAFVAACIQSMPLERQEDFLSKAIWVEDEKSFRSLTSRYQGLLLVLAPDINILPVERS